MSSQRLLIFKTLESIREREKRRKGKGITPKLLIFQGRLSHNGGISFLLMQGSHLRKCIRDTSQRHFKLVMQYFVALKGNIFICHLPIPSVLFLHTDFCSHHSLPISAVASFTCRNHADTLKLDSRGCVPFSAPA